MPRHHAHNRTHPKQAGYVYKRSFWRSKRSKQKRQWLHRYQVLLPRSRPFLPSDAIVRKMVAQFPGITIVEIARFPDRDVLMLAGPNKNIFTVRADEYAQRKRDELLTELGETALPERYIPEEVRDACEHLLKEYRFERVEWNHGHLTPLPRPTIYTKRDELETKRISLAIADIQPSCRRLDPFTLEVAHS